MQEVAQQFLFFLTDRITDKVTQIKTGAGDSKHLADEVQLHVSELRTALDTLFADEVTRRPARKAKEA